MPSRRRHEDFEDFFVLGADTPPRPRRYDIVWMSQADLQGEHERCCAEREGQGVALLRTETDATGALSRKAPPPLTQDALGDSLMAARTAEAATEKRDLGRTYPWWWVTSVDAIRAAERRVAPTSDDELALIERAGHAAWLALRAFFRDRGVPCPTNVLVLAGSGNNGADGLEVAKIALKDGLRVCVVMPQRPRAGSVAERIFQRWRADHPDTLQEGDKICESLKDSLGASHPHAAPRWKETLDHRWIVVDALFGIGWRPHSKAVKAVKAVNVVNVVNVVNIVKSASENSSNVTSSSGGASRVEVVRQPQPDQADQTDQADLRDTLRLDRLIERLGLRSAHVQGKPWVMALDLPSGLHADSGAIHRGDHGDHGDHPENEKGHGVLSRLPLWPLVADVTVTFAHLKRVHLTYPASDICGEIRIVDIGLAVTERDRTEAERDRGLSRVEPSHKPSRLESRLGSEKDWVVVHPDMWRGSYPTPRWDDHKYRRGTVAVLASGSMPGAAHLAAKAAQRMGCGMVSLVGREGNATLPLLAQGSIVVRLARDTAEISDILADSKLHTVVIGPGMVDDARSYDYALKALSFGKRVVLDASVLRVVANDDGKLWQLLHAQRSRVATSSSIDHAIQRYPMVITPHEGEFEALFPLLKDLPKPQAAAQAAQHSGAVVVLKGAATVIATPLDVEITNASSQEKTDQMEHNAVPVMIHRSPTSVLATAGTGDVLAGCIAGAWALGMPAPLACATAVWMHAHAAQGLGTIAEDIVNTLPHVWAKVMGQW